MRKLSDQAVHSDLACPARRAVICKFGAMTSALLLGQSRLAHAVALQRIVSIGGSLTEIIFALQAQAQLVGVDTTSDFPSAAQKLPNVGYTRTLSAEGILALAPSMIIATEDAGPPAVIAQLSAAGIPVHVLRANHRFEGLLERVYRVGELTGHTQEAKQLTQTLWDDWQKTQVNLIDHKKRRVLFILSHNANQMMVAGKNTSAHAVLEYAGACNAMTEFNGYKPLTPEALVAAQPDIILMTESGLSAIGGMKGLLNAPGVAQTPAGRQRRILAFDTMYLLGFGPRLPAAVKALNNAITQIMSKSE